MISIITCCYNREKYIAQTIESILAQTHKDFELIIWDDGSTDNSIQIIEQYAARDKRIKLVLGNHQGFTKSLKNAFAISNGEYLCSVDSDDYIAPTCLEETKRILDDKSTIGVVYTQYIEIDENDNKLGIGKRCKLPYSKERLLLGHIVFHFRLMRRNTFLLVGGINEKSEYAQDYDLVLKLSEVADFYRLERPLYYYRIHRNRISEEFKTEQMRESWKAINNAVKRRNKLK